MKPAMTDTGDKTKDITINLQAANHENLEKLQPLRKPEVELSLSLQLLTSEDWTKKVKGLCIIRAVAQHHPHTLIPTLYPVCTSVSDEVRNPRSTVAVAAIDTLRYLYVYLRKNMDALVERTGVCLLQRIAQSNANDFIQQRVNMALQAMVQNCSSGRHLSVLNTGLNNLNRAVRTSAAQQLHLLADMMGVNAIFEADESFTHKFLTAVCKMCVDADPKVRSHGHDILRKMTVHKDLMMLFNGIMSDKYRWPMTKILRNTK
ncbi:TOG array regulator of axonemal microtubules protein 2-like [Chaetodon trifascialis]|uniref:TOG array regulator of axonemal microtubules protein 2-like n=1 Tax=Chaetodon trifascialis TaxID=109706 RepID=UPI0039926AE6